MPAILLLLLALFGCADSREAPAPAPSAQSSTGSELAVLRESMAGHNVELDAEAAQLGDIEAQQAQDQVHMHEVERLLGTLGSLWDAVSDDYRRAASAYNATAERYEVARLVAAGAAAAYEEARAEWERAASAWKVAALMIAAANAIETHRLHDGALRNVARESELDCNQGMSTRSYRNKFDVPTGMDVDHIVPHSLGGADHPLNYQLLTVHENRSLGNLFDATKCTSAGAAQCAIAIAVSTRCAGYRGGIPGM